MVELILLQKLFTALLIGLIIGLEREIAQETRQNVKFAGLRTFGIVGLIGGIAAYLTTGGYAIFAAALAAIAALTIVAYYRSTEIEKHLGFTTETALLLTFLLGGLAYYEQAAAIILTIIVTILLAFKEPLHAFTYRIPKEEFYDSLKFALIALVILPVLPDKAYGPLEAFNPYQIWLIVVILTGISFIGYFLVKWFGAGLGLPLTGLMGGLASSTAVTTSMAMRTRENSELIYPAMVASTLSNMVMLLRVVFIISIFFAGLVPYVYLPVGMMCLTSILVASYFYLQGRGNGKAGQIQLKTPFNIVPALLFAAFITIVLFISRAALLYLGSYGLFLTSAAAGLADVDAITVSTARLAASGLADPSTAVTAIMIAVFVNLAVHSAYAFYFGTKRFGLYNAAMAAIVIASGIIVIALT
ncbi:MgtC/SapB family protein [Methanocella conradii]|uniref:MgtC/SapB family protein n=1 Tax=Methanocella conradii TaxID=1175444 RepID=UPI0024B3797E|nr:MgtC/SapB family protein [Methanocella conradii]MDI6895890.1 MgtC/SapB family protein [Methanocella conradii]